MSKLERRSWNIGSLHLIIFRVGRILSRQNCQNRNRQRIKSNVSLKQNYRNVYKAFLQGSRVMQNDVTSRIFSIKRVDGGWVGDFTTSRQALLYWPIQSRRNRSVSCDLGFGKSYKCSKVVNWDRRVFIHLCYISSEVGLFSNLSNFLQRIKSKRTFKVSQTATNLTTLDCFQLGHTWVQLG